MTHVQGRPAFSSFILSWQFWVFATLVAILSGTTSTTLIRWVLENDYRNNLTYQAERAASHLQGWSLTGKGMGAVSLAGQLDPTIQQVAQETSIERAKHNQNAHRALEILARGVDSKHAVVINRDGLITGDWDEDGISPIGINVGFRPYVKQAMRGVESVYGGSSSSTGRRTFYVAAPVYNQPGKTGEIIGTIAVRFEASSLDKFMSSQHSQGLFVSPQGVVFSASNPAWNLNIAGDIHNGIIARLHEGKQFGKAFAIAENVHPLPFSIQQETVVIDGEEYALSRATVNWNDVNGPWSLVLIAPLHQAFSVENQIITTTSIFLLVFLMFLLWRKNIRSQWGRIQANIELEHAAKKISADAHLKSRLAILSNEMQTADDFSSVSSILFSQLADIFSIQQGSLYFQQNHQLKLIGHYGSHHLPAIIEKHEGLVGQCFAEQQIIIRKVPEESYWKISSGLGRAHAEQVVLMPVMQHEQILGILEIATLSRQSLDIESIQAILPILARNLERIEQHHKFSELFQTACQESEQHLFQLQFQQDLIDSIPCPIFYKGADTRFLGFNIAYEQIFGVSRDDLLGKRVLDLVYLPEEDRRNYQKEDEDVINQDGTVQREMPIPFSDGKLHRTLYYVSSLPRRNHQPMGLVGTIIDLGIIE